MIIDFVEADERTSVKRFRLSKKAQQRIETGSYCLALLALWILALSICAHIK